MKYKIIRQKDGWAVVRASECPVETELDAQKLVTMLEDGRMREDQVEWFHPDIINGLSQLFRRD